MKTTDASGVDYKSAPRDYAELHRIYYTYVVSLVARMGIDRTHAEDVASDILLRFQERGFLDKFNPDLTFVYDGQTRPARFKSFLSKFALSYVRGHRDKLHRLTYREPLLCDVIYADADGRAGAGATWVEIYGDPQPNHEDAVLDEVTYRRYVTALREHLAGVPRRSATDACDLLALFDAVIAQLDRYGELNITALRHTFGVSSTAMHSWIWWLRANLADATGKPLPAKRPRTPRPS